MYNTICKLLTVGLVLLLSFVLKAQDHNIYEPIKLSELREGQQLSRTVWDHQFQLLNSEGAISNFSFRSVQDKKLIILDFWSTWCGTCINSMPGMHQLLHPFSESIAFVPLTYQSSDIIVSAINRFPTLSGIKGFETIVGDTVFQKLFPPKAGLPHLVILDGSGTVLAITKPRYLNDQVLRALLKGEEYVFPVVFDQRETKAPILVPRQAFAQLAPSIQYSFLSGPIKGLSSFVRQENDSLSNTKRLVFFNYTPLKLYEYAFKDSLNMDFPSFVNFLNRREIDSTLAELITQQFTYESVFSLGTSIDPKKKLKHDLDSYLHVESKIVNREMDVLVLVKASNGSGEIIPSTERKLPISIYIGRLNSTMLALDLPIIKGLEDELWPGLRQQIEDDDSLETIKNKLQQVGLDLIPQRAVLKMFALTQITQ